jgi:hypothetical protein
MPRLDIIVPFTGIVEVGRIVMKIVVRTVAWTVVRIAKIKEIVVGIVIEAMKVKLVELTTNR